MVSYTPDTKGRNAITVTNGDGSSVTVYEQGAHLTSWKTTGGVEHLYLSPTAIYADRVALRGGVPIIFPQFGTYGPMRPSHGFARIRPWKVEEAGAGHAVFSLRVPIADLHADGMAMQECSNDAVVLTYSIKFSNAKLLLSMKVTNLSEEYAAPFQFAFHTYFAVSSVERTVINGVNLSPFIDNNKSKGNPNTPVEPAEPLWVIRGEHDRIYPNQQCAILLQDLDQRRVTHVSSPNLRDVCLWNPGAAKCAALKDMPPDGFKNFVCVEHGAMLKKAIIPQCSSWIGSQEIVILPSSPDSKV